MSAGSMLLGMMLQILGKLSLQTTKTTKPKKRITQMEPKKDIIFCFRWSEDIDTKFRDYAAYNGLSSGALVRKILRQYLISKQVINQRSNHD